MYNAGTDKGKSQHSWTGKTVVVALHSGIYRSWDSRTGRTVGLSPSTVGYTDPGTPGREGQWDCRVMSSLANECPFGNVGFPHVPVCGYMLPNQSPSPNLYKVLSVYNNNVAL